MAQGERGEWLLVQHADELRAGALVEVRPCAFCGKTERLMLLRRVAPSSGASLTGAGDFMEAAGCWSVAPGLCANPRGLFDPSAAIASGRLWRRAEKLRELERESRVGVPASRP